MPESIYHIYKHTSKTSSKSYIGITNNLKHRWSCHKSTSNRGSDYHFYRAMRKYGIDDWQTEILSTVETLTLAEYLERYFIKIYDSYKNGYNMTEGGSAFAGLSGEANGMYGKTHTNEVKQLLASYASDRFKGKSYEILYGKEKAAKLKDLRKNQLRESRKLNSHIGKNNPRAKKVSIRGKIFDTSKDAANFFNRSPAAIVYWLKNKDDCWYI